MAFLSTFAPSPFYGKALYRQAFNAILGSWRTLAMPQKYALITGASRGIGRAIAKEYAQAGYHLILTCKKNIDELSDYASLLSKVYGIKCHAKQVDGSNFEAVQALFDSIERLDVLINNAGISYIGLLTDMTPSDWDNVLNSNLTSMFYTCKNAIPLFLKQGVGRIINISSVWGTMGASTEVAYSASKGGVNAFTKALAKELAPSAIAVNAIAPGVIDTDMNRAHLSEDDLESLATEIPADRLGNVNEVATLALQLASSPLYMTGQIITIDGGWY